MDMRVLIHAKTTTIGTTNEMQSNFIWLND